MSVFDQRRSETWRSGRGTIEVRRTGRWLAPGLMALSAALLATNLVEPKAFDPVRGQVIAWSAPVIEAATGVLAPMNRALARLLAFASDSNDSARLRAENARFAALAARVEDLERENAELRRLTHDAGSAPFETVTARVIASSPGPLSQTLLINAGRNGGLKTGAPVQAGSSLLGRLIQVHAGYALVMTLSDRQSRLPVEIGPNRTRAVLSGTGGGWPKLEFLGARAAIAAGDLVVTSGVGGIFPRAMPVGVVVADGHDWSVALSAQAQVPSIVKILKLEPGTLDAPQLQQAAGPLASSTAEAPK